MFFFRLKILDQKREALYQKQGFTDMFKSVAERDDHFRKEIKRLDRMIAETRSQISTLKAEIAQEENVRDEEQGAEAVRGLLFSQGFVYLSL